jgi:hypothetical protein
MNTSVSIRKRSVASIQCCESYHAIMYCSDGSTWSKNLEKMIKRADKLRVNWWRREANYGTRVLLCCAEIRDAIRLDEYDAVESEM